MSAVAPPADRLAEIVLDSATVAARAYRAALLHANPGLERRFIAERRISTAEWLGEVDRRQSQRRYAP